MADRRRFDKVLGWWEVGRKLERMEKRIMASIGQIRDEVAGLRTAIDAEQEQIASAIAALQAIVADGGTVEERQAVLDELIAARADLSSTIPDPVEP